MAGETIQEIRDACFGRSRQVPGVAMRAFFFPGQMSEHPAMWPNLERRVPDAGKLLRRAESASGLRLEPFCRAGDAPHFDDLTAQVMVLAVNAAWAGYLCRNGVMPDAVTGHSLGCYSAFEAAGVLRFEDAVWLAVLVQRLAEQELAGFDGAMGVLIGHRPETVADACLDAGEDDVQVANVNTARQVVISGRAAAVDAVLARLADDSMRAERLHTALPFHSRWMRPVTRRLLREVDPDLFHPPRLALFSHLDGARVESAREAHELLCTQIARTLVWPRALESMRAHGCSRFVETGPGDVLTRMTRWVLRDIEVSPVERDVEELIGGRSTPGKD